MNEKNKIKEPTHVSVKISKIVVDLVREDKKKTKVSVGGFFELAALEKLNKNK